MDFLLSADDFGFNLDTAERTIRCFEEGVLTSASIMAAAPAMDKACSFARARREFSFGVHLCFCDDEAILPLAAPSTIASLTTPDGRFLETRAVIRKALTGKLSVDDITREAAEQIGRMRDMGVDLAYVDGHGNLHKFPPFMAALERVLPRFGIRRVRRAQTVYLRDGWKRPGYWLGMSLNLLIARRFTTTSAFYLPASSADSRWSYALWTRVGNAKGTIEIGVHPGAVEAWRAAEENELRALAAILAENGRTAKGWKDLP